MSGMTEFIKSCIKIRCKKVDIDWLLQILVKDGGKEVYHLHFI